MTIKYKKKNKSYTNLNAEDVFNALKERGIPEVLQPFIVGMKFLSMGKLFTQDKILKRKEVISMTRMFKYRLESIEDPTVKGDVYFSKLLNSFNLELLGLRVIAAGEEVEVTDEDIQAEKDFLAHHLGISRGE